MFGIWCETHTAPIPTVFSTSGVGLAFLLFSLIFSRELLLILRRAITDFRTLIFHPTT